MRLKQIIATLVVVSLYLVANAYIFVRLYTILPPTSFVRLTLTALAIIVQIPVIVSIFIGDRLPTLIVSILYKIGTSWIIIFLYLFLFFVLFDVSLLLGIINYETLMEYYGRFGLAVVGAITLMLLIGHRNYYRKKRVELNITTDKHLQRPLKIVFSSDWHLGYGIGRREVDSWVKMINAEKPDLVLIGGDLIDNHTRPLWESEMYLSLQELKARYGVFAVLGNHEYFGDTQKRTAFLKKSGIKVLRDSVATIKDICYIVGREDASRSYRARLKNLTDSLDHTRPIIVIDHQPSSFPEAIRSRADLLLSGHTHGGQVAPLNVAVKAFYRYTYGYYFRSGTHFYITSGLGIWGGKFRLGTRSEYVVVNLSQNEVV